MVDLQAWSYANWLKIPALLREDCLATLREIPANVVDTWSTQFSKGRAIGGGGLFHMCEGMNIRNRLRSALTDNELPEGGGNWDDYYMGALQELIVEHRKKTGWTDPATPPAETGHYYCTIGMGTNQGEMENWLRSINHHGIFKEAWETPHPLAANEHNLGLHQVPCASFTNLNQARDFRKRFGGEIYTIFAPYHVE